jgi:phage anti-repressor protein
MYKIIVSFLDPLNINFVWASNNHIGDLPLSNDNLLYIKNKNHRWFLGHYLKNKFKDNYCIILSQVYDVFLLGGYPQSKKISSLIYIMTSFKDFLLTQNTIKKTFINDFFEIIREDYFEISDQFLINSNKLQLWLNITSRKDFHFTIKNSYRINIDYIIIKNENKIGKGGRNEIIYMLTPDCAKMILQSTKSKKGTEVRKYFIEIEKMLYKYKDTIIKSLSNELTLVKNNQKPKPDNKKRKIYIFKALNTNETLYKLGKTTNLKNRLKTYNSGNANDIEPLFILPVNDIDSVESCVKKCCKKYQYRKYKEVYEIDIDVLKEVMTDCNDFVNKMAIKLSDKTEKKNLNNAD